MRKVSNVSFIFYFSFIYNFLLLHYDKIHIVAAACLDLLLLVH